MLTHSPQPHNIPLPTAQPAMLLTQPTARSPAAGSLTLSGVLQRPPRSADAQANKRCKLAAALPPSPAALVSPQPSPLPDTLASAPASPAAALPPKFAFHQKVLAPHRGSGHKYTAWVVKVTTRAAAPPTYRLKFSKEKAWDDEVFHEAVMEPHPDPGLHCCPCHAARSHSHSCSLLLTPSLPRSTTDIPFWEKDKLRNRRQNMQQGQAAGSASRANSDPGPSSAGPSRAGPSSAGPSAGAARPRPSKPASPPAREPERKNPARNANCSDAWCQSACQGSKSQNCKPCGASSPLTSPPPPL